MANRGTELRECTEWGWGCRESGQKCVGYGKSEEWYGDAGNQAGNAGNLGGNAANWSRNAGKRAEIEKEKWKFIKSNFVFYVEIKRKNEIRIVIKR